MQYQTNYLDESNQLKKVCSALCFGCAVIMIVSQGLTNILALAVYFLSPRVASSPWFSSVCYAVVLYGIAVPLFCLIMKRFPTWKDRTHQRLQVHEWLTYGVMSLGFAYLFNLLSSLVNYMIGILRGRPVQNPVDASIENIWITLLFSVILAPIFEEFIFRGIVINKLKRYGDAVCIFMSATLFAMLHGNLSQIFYAFALGLIFAYVTIKTGTIRHAIILHMFVNLCGGVIFPYLANSSNLFVTGITGLSIYVFIIAAAVLLFVNFYQLKKLRPGIFIRESKAKCMFLNPGMALYAVTTLCLVILFLMVY